MLRIIHTADVHLGARHDDLGDQAAAQRERQFAAFRATVDLALAEKVDLFLIAGDLFDSNVQPRRSVERVAAELKRLVEARIRTVIIPGHPRRLRPDLDLSRLRPQGDGRQHRPRRPRHRPHARRARVHLAALDAVVYGRRLRHQARPVQPARRTRRVDRCGGCDLADRHGPRLDRHPRQDRSRRGRHHDRGDRRTPARLPRARSLALDAAGARRRAWPTRTPARPRRSPSTRIARARSLLVELEDADGKRTSRSRTGSSAGRTFQRVQLDAARVGANPRSSRAWPSGPTPTSCSTSRIVGVRPDELDLHIDEIETALAASFLKVRVRDVRCPH